MGVCGNVRNDLRILARFSETVNSCWMNIEDICNLFGRIALLEELHCSLFLVGVKLYGTAKSNTTLLGCNSPGRCPVTNEVTFKFGHSVKDSENHIPSV